MLTHLTITNFGLIEHLDLDFHEKLNIFTGETGAGKSIIIGALRVILGEKLLSTQIRNNDAACVLEGVFDLAGTEVINSPLLEDFVDEDQTELIIHRSFSPKGRKKNKINGMNVTVAQLKDIGSVLMDFHGPHDHQMLLCADYHLGMLDRLIMYGDEWGDLEQTFKEYKNIQKHINELAQLSSTREREMDLLAHQVKELEQVSLKEEDYQAVRYDVSRVNHAEKLSAAVSELLDLLSDDAGASRKIRQAFSPMQSLVKTDESASPFEESLNQLQELNDQLLIDLKDYAMSLSFDASAAELANEKYDVYYDILKKYGPSLADAETFYYESKERLDLLTNLEHNDSQLKKDLTKVTKRLDEICAGITKKRKKAATQLIKTIEKELKELGINHVQFDVKITKGDYTDTGADDVEFYISPNAGEELKPLARVVSSGEAARVMLGLKKALIKVDPIPILIFDEIDAQIGGRLGTITGRKLKEIAQNRQVLLITHLPQIASFADLHLKVIKLVKNKRAQTTVETLNDQQRVAELAEMMGGDDDHTLSVKHAEDMLQSAAK